MEKNFHGFFGAAIAKRLDAKNNSAGKGKAVRGASSLVFHATFGGGTSVQLDPNLNPGHYHGSIPRHIQWQGQFFAMCPFLFGSKISLRIIGKFFSL